MANYENLFKSLMTHAKEDSVEIAEISDDEIDNNLNEDEIRRFSLSKITRLVTILLAKHKTWIDYMTSSSGVSETAVANGILKKRSYKNAFIYRFVADSGDKSLDVIYEDEAMTTVLARRV